METIRKISRAGIDAFQNRPDGLPYRILKNGDCAIADFFGTEKDSLLSLDGFFRIQLDAARENRRENRLDLFWPRKTAKRSRRREASVFVPVPQTDFLLDGVTRVAVKLVMNALSTCTMVRLGRVMGNYMIWVVPSNLKLIDRATRYISKLDRFALRTRQRSCCLKSSNMSSRE